MERRAEDSRINKLVEDVAVLQSQMIENTAMTRQVRDILGSFRIMAAIAKWVAAIGAGVAALYHGVDFLRRH